MDIVHGLRFGQYLCQNSRPCIIYAEPDAVSYAVIRALFCGKTVDCRRGDHRNHGTPSTKCKKRFHDG